jgi:hypothetical protein
MQNRKRTGPPGAPVFTVGKASPIFRSLLLTFLTPLLAAAIFAGCASPSEPVDRKPPTPEAVTDLAVEQSGNDVLLTFTLPKDTVDDRPLDQTPAIEIYRDLRPALKPGEQPAAAANSTLLATIPAAMTPQYAEQGRIRYADALAPSDFASSSDRTAVYVVRTRVSPKRDSANSNPAVLRVFPAPEPVADLKVQVTHSGISLTWTPPEKDLTGSRPAIGGYRIYRAEASPAAPAGAAGKTSEVRMVRIAELDSAAGMYLDGQINFGDTYSYAVRSVVEYSGKELESADSNVAVVEAKDTFPPAAPENLVLTPLPAQQGAAAHLELSWQISPESDLAGYNVYRSEQSGALGTRQNTELLLTPAFRDMSAVPGRQYFYRVTAVDHAGNESSASTAVSGEIPTSGQP